MSTERSPVRLRMPAWMLAAAVFLVSLLGGALWWSLWLTPGGERRAGFSRPGVPEQPVYIVGPVPDPLPPKPLPPEPGVEVDLFGDGAESSAQRLAEAQRRARERYERETKELERLIEAHRRALAVDLPRARPKRAAGADPDEEAAVESAAPVVAESSSREGAANGGEASPIGQVLFVEAEAKDAVVLRGDQGALTRTPLTPGAMLMAGDRLETQRLNDRACAAVRLKGGATVDLAGETTVQVCNVGHLRLESGRIYACVQRGGNEADEYRPSFLLETAAGRFLTEGAQMEVSAASNLSIQSQTSAKIDSGRVFLLNDKGRALGVRGQELRALSQQAPTLVTQLSGPVWRGRDLGFGTLPCGPSNPIVVLNDTPRNCLLEEYALSLAHDGTRQVVAVGAGFGGNLMGNYKELYQYLQTLKKRGLRNAPEVLLGNGRALQKPASGRAEDTRAESSPAVRRLVELARQTTPERPVLAICSGSMNEVAAAWLIERRCGACLVPVFGYDDGDYKSVGRDPWAAEIVLSKFRCIVLTRTYRPPIDTALYDRIPNPLWRDLTRQQGCADTALLAAVAMPGLARDVERAVCMGDGNGRFRFEAHAKGTVWLVKDIEMDALQQELIQTFFER